eukprot:CAMPEP_0197310940 /NCGR_PEP_ID=MMETSP0891-20130614/9472_1 /TAXON_ID=44058 ORGANISM="Aureoumbra lagunensis, Strain CCMP1510" /NCGR_SAMPLE_ID=MMETSP0891 /ASSEMBLY_ACC=CAM_ASM_000534 /LENGTH=49 /DNA_ID= /DNA_START= /DNA_END= /DNA_ORIENTATION=
MDISDDAKTEPPVHNEKDHIIAALQARNEALQAANEALQAKNEAIQAKN